jgi:hypothetical protein
MEKALTSASEKLFVDWAGNLPAAKLISAVKDEIACKNNTIQLAQVLKHRLRDRNMPVRND